MRFLGSDASTLDPWPAHLRKAFQDIDLELKSVNKDLKHLRNKQHKAFRQHIEQELVEASVLSFSECWKCARLLSRMGRGPKHRRYGLTVLEHPSPDVYREFFAQPGPLGGMATKDIVFDKEFEDIQIIDCDPLLAEHNLLQKANADLNMLFWCLLEKGCSSQVLSTSVCAK